MQCEKVRYAMRRKHGYRTSAKSQESYKQLFEKQERGLSNPKLIIQMLTRSCCCNYIVFSSTSWNAVKCISCETYLFMYHRIRERFAGQLKGIWQASDLTIARQRAKELGDEYGDKCPKAINILEDGLEDALPIFFPSTRL